MSTKDDDKAREYAAKLRPMIETPNLKRWLANTELTELGARGILDYAQEELKKAMQDQAHPVMVMQSFIAAYAAACIGANVPPNERLDFLVAHYKLIAPVVEENIEAFKPNREGAAITLN